MGTSLFQQQAQSSLATARNGEIDPALHEELSRTHEMEARRASSAELYSELNIPDVIAKPMSEIDAELQDTGEIIGAAFRSIGLAGGVYGAVKDYADNPADLFGFETVDPIT